MCKLPQESRRVRSVQRGGDGGGGWTPLRSWFQPYQKFDPPGPRHQAWPRLFQIEVIVKLPSWFVHPQDRLHRRTLRTSSCTRSTWHHVHVVYVRSSLKEFDLGYRRTSRLPVSLDRDLAVGLPHHRSRHTAASVYSYVRVHVDGGIFHIPHSSEAGWDGHGWMRKVR